MIHAGQFKLVHITVHPFYDLTVVFRGDLRIVHVPAGQLFGQDLIENVILIKGDGFVDAALGVGLGGNGGAVLMLGKGPESCIVAQAKSLLSILS